MLGVYERVDGGIVHDRDGQSDLVAVLRADGVAGSAGCGLELRDRPIQRGLPLARGEVPRPGQGGAPDGPDCLSHLRLVGQDAAQAWLEAARKLRNYDKMAQKVGRIKEGPRRVDAQHRIEVRQAPESNEPTCRSNRRQTTRGG